MKLLSPAARHIDQQLVSILMQRLQLSSTQICSCQRKPVMNELCSVGQYLSPHPPWPPSVYAASVLAWQQPWLRQTYLA